MVNQITLLGRENHNMMRFPYLVFDRAQNQHILLDNINQASTFKQIIGMCLACNDAHE